VSHGLPRNALTLALAAFYLVLTPPAHADASRLTWNPAWTRFRVIEYGVIGGATAGTLLLHFAIPDANEPRWVGGLLLDEPLRDALRLQSPEARDAARTASDLTALSTVVWAVGVDSVVVPLVRHSSDVAGQLTAMDAESFALSSLIATVLFKAAARARPSYADCHRETSFDPLCKAHRLESFPSGHTTVSFTAAGLSCAHHLHAALYGNSVADALACAGTISLAASTGTLRVLGDRHYASDVAVGAIIGFAVGYGVPTLFHYGKVDRTSSSAQALEPLGAGVGPTISGTF
jgi:membrane-associated phospholipid phosphatase